MHIPEETIQDFLNTAPAVLYEYVLLPDGRSEFLYISPSSKEILGHEPNYFMADMDRMWSLIHPDDLERVKNENLTANKENKIFISYLRTNMPTGSVRWMQVSSKPTNRQVKGGVIWSGYIVDITRSKELEEEKNKLIEELNTALAEVKTLQGIIPICSYCHEIRDDRGAWEQLEAYITKHSEAKFSHSICPKCIPKLKKEIANMKAKKD